MKSFYVNFYTKIFLCAIFLLFLAPCAFSYEEELFCDEIFLEGESLKLNLEKSLPKTYKESLQKEESGLSLDFGALNIFTNSKTELNDYMVNDYKTTTGATLNPNGRLSLTGGMEVKYQNPDASINSKKFYVTPNLRLTENVSLTFANKFNHDSKVYENEVGLQYSPKFLKNYAEGAFGVSAGTVFDEEEIKSQKLKFTTDFYLF